ncbi:hypothetical protein GQ54DRAFT_265314 [Martensiomyces pterosporus]|nr:hypothetical protein GQ54DRAFT_265314 [Martensiomyces pterosporus]
MSLSPERVKVDERYHLTQLKEQLAEALGEDGPSYWNALRDFVQGKLNRQEFDFYAYMYLSGDKATLHNKFILATIHNAQTGQAPPDGEPNRGFERRKRSHEEGEENAEEAGGDEGGNKHARRSIKALLEDPKWRYIKELVKSLNKSERRAIKTLLKRPNITPQQAQEAIRAMKPVILPLPAAQLPQSYAMDIAKGITAPLVYDTKATPDIESLSYRMVAIALEQGLPGGVARDAGELLLYALDCHLKNIVSNMIYKIRSNRALGIPVANISAEAAAAASGPDKTTLHLSDLVFSLEISPNATVEPPLCLERCGNLMANQDLASDDTANDTGDGGSPPSGMFPNGPALSSSNAAAANGSTGVLAAASASGISGAADGFGEDDDDHKQRRKIRRLRQRYERWFGPYVTVQYGGAGNGSQKDL